MRAEFERKMRADGWPVSRIWEGDAGELPQPAAARDAYFPVTYLYPPTGNQAALGFDLGSEPRRKRALLAAIETGKTVRTEPIRLVQNPEHWAFLVFKPVYARRNQVTPGDAGRPELVGIVSAVYQYRSFLDAVLRRAEIVGQHIALFDTTQPSFPVYVHYSRAVPGERPDLEHPLTVIASAAGARSMTVATMQHELSAVFISAGVDATWWRRINATIFATLVIGLLVTAALVWNHIRASRLTARLSAATEEARLKKEGAEMASVAKSRFLAAASHDLRQPIQAAALFIDNLKHSQLDAKQQRTIGYLDQSVKSVRDLLDALLDISKLDAGVVSPRIETFGVSKLLSGIEAEFASQALAKGLRMNIHLPQPDILVKSDSHLVVTILRNLVSNAVTYTNRGGILVGARRRANRVALQVWDTGIGMHEDHLDRIYEEFYQIDNPQRDRSKGFGIGLAIARRAADLLGCGLTCASRVGRGSLFELVLPVGREGIEEAAPVVSAARNGLAGKRFVLVEDDLLVAESIALWLEEGGSFVARYASAEEALSDAEIVGADCYISDYRLPGAMDGIEFLNVMRARAGHTVSGIVVTGDTSPTFIERAKRSGWRVLFKPVDPRLLLEALEG
jgi:signal transduction histidine kinase